MGTCQFQAKFYGVGASFTFENLRRDVDKFHIQQGSTVKPLPVCKNQGDIVTWRFSDCIRYDYPNMGISL